MTGFYDIFSENVPKVTKLIQVENVKSCNSVERFMCEFIRTSKC